MSVYGPLPGSSGSNIELLSYKGVYDASTNTPTLVNGTGTAGDWYYVSVAGTNNPTGTLLNVGEGIAYNGTIWQKIPATTVNDTDDVIVAPTYTVISNEVVTIGETTTRALGALQGQINAIKSPTGILKSNGTVISAATSGTDYSAGTASLATGILKSTTTTGTLSIAIAADFPTLNQNTTGNASTATTLQTARNIYGNSFNGSADLTQIIASTYGGTGNGFTKFSGATTSEKTYTLPDATCNILTDNAVVTVAQGGTGVSSINAYSVVIGGATNTDPISTVSGLGTATQVLTSQGAGLPPVWANSPAATGGVDPYNATITYNEGEYIAGDGTNGILGGIYVCLQDGTTGAFNISYWAILSGLNLSNFNAFSCTYSTPTTISGQYNSFNGYNAGFAPVVSGSHNDVFGSFAFTGVGTISGEKNAGFGGASANGAVTTASYNTWAGFGSLASMTTANYNVCIGYLSGSNITIGNANILIGDLGTAGAFDNNFIVSNPQNNNQIINIDNTDTPLAANLVLATPNGSTGALSPRQLTSSDIISYSQSFNATTDWGSPSGGLYTISIPSVTHGQGVNVVSIQIYEVSGSNLILTTVNQVIIDSTNGDVSFNVTQTPDARFAGKIFIIGAA